MAGPQKITVLLTRNENGTVAGTCLLGDFERPVIDGDTPAEVLATIEDVLEGLLLSRRGTLSGRTL